MTSIDFNPHIQIGACAAISTLVGGTVALVAAKELQKGWSGACWAYSQGWSAPGQIAAQGMEFLKAIPSKGREAWQGMGTVLRSKQVAIALLSSVSTSLSFKYSPMAVEKQLPLRSKDYAIENRMLAIVSVVFLANVCGLEALRQTYSLSHFRALAHSVSSAVISLGIVTVATKYEATGFKYNQKCSQGDFFDYFVVGINDDIYKWFNEDKQKVQRYKDNHNHSDVAWKQAGEMGVNAGISVLALTFIPKTMQAIHRSVPSTKGIYPAALVMPPMMIGRKFLCSYLKDGFNENQERILILAVLLTVPVAGTVLTSKLSAAVLKDRVGYLSSAAIVVSGFVATVAIEINSLGSESND